MELEWESNSCSDVPPWMNRNLKAVGFIVFQPRATLSRSDRAAWKAGTTAASPPLPEIARAIHSHGRSLQPPPDGTASLTCAPSVPNYLSQKSLSSNLRQRKYVLQYLLSNE